MQGEDGVVPMEEGADSEDAAEEGLQIKSSIDAESPDGAPNTPPRNTPSTYTHSLRRTLAHTLSRSHILFHLLCR